MRMNEVCHYGSLSTALRRIHTSNRDNKIINRSTPKHQNLDNKYNQINSKQFMMKDEVVKKYYADNAIRVLLAPQDVSLHETLKPIAKNVDEKKEKKSKKKKRMSDDEELLEKKKPMRKVRGNHAKLMCDDRDAIVFDFGMKRIDAITLGRGTSNPDPSFVNLSQYTSSRSISHKHATIRYDKQLSFYVFVNEGTNGSIVNGANLLEKGASAILTDNSVMELGGFKLSFHYNNN
ncbi:hypothetical protein EIN_223630 [Entamoeba invadens IP1]|uniref:FHA domain-containing protein n=1 Tax=Entamoeba invadens IP1 TaxID=370355 RepID=A0A0A1U5M0_ENTIV|nr:hypothetical protein EIN_223630 [Entamoeba invadens IP1]ELP88150.1 hypothetical protein EIN_223630 [Entamoeba invadens IP1]|eukprot:XP_004254921.1 hypothetical protein EIN_223630 [Entamoeba invadens IP1]